MVVGTGKCGSSCLTGVLQIMGLYIGHNFANPRQGENPKGTFENWSVAHLNYRINIELTKQYGISPGPPGSLVFYFPVINWNKEPRKEELKGRIKSCLQKEFGNYCIFGIKEIRISFLLPIYVEVVKELGYIPKIIVMLREPKEIARSFEKRFSSPLGEDLYFYISRNLMSVLEHSIGYDMIAVHFNDLLNETERVVERLRKFIPGLKSYGQVKEQLENFINKDLKHENYP